MVSVVRQNDVAVGIEIDTSGGNIIVGLKDLKTFIEEADLCAAQIMQEYSVMFSTKKERKPRNASRKEG